MAGHRVLRHGEVFIYLVENRGINEDEARILFGRLCLSVGYVRDRDAVRLDLNLGHVLLDVLLDERCRLKLADFGFTRELEKRTLSIPLRDYWVR